jgi:hypothetical protein
MLLVRAGSKYSRVVYRPEVGHELESGTEENGEHGRSLWTWLLQQVQPLSLVVPMVMKYTKVVMLTC